MKIKLNKTTSIELCSSKVDGALNASTFEAKSDWVIEKDNGEQFATRYTYSTLHCRKYGEYFMCGNPKAAIQQAILNALRMGKQPYKRLKDVYFILVPEIEKIKTVKNEKTKQVSQFATEQERYDFNVWLEHYHIVGKGVDYQSKKKKQIHQKYIIVKDENKACINLYINSPEFDKWLNEKIKQYKQHE